MFKRITSVLLSFTMLINLCFAQELKTENNFDLQEAPMVWTPQKKKMKFGNLEFTIWIMPKANLLNPHPGYLIYRSDLGQLKERLDNLQKTIEARIASERADCDIQLKQKDEDCAELNKALREKFDASKIKVDDLTLSLSKEETFSKNLMIGGGITIFALTTAIVFTSLSTMK